QINSIIAQNLISLQHRNHKKWPPPPNRLQLQFFSLEASSRDWQYGQPSKSLYRNHGAVLNRHKSAVGWPRSSLTPSKQQPRLPTTSTLKSFYSRSCQTNSRFQ